MIHRKVVKRKNTGKTDAQIGFLDVRAIFLKQNLLENRLKNEVQIEDVLMLIFYEFLTILAAKFGSKIAEKSIQNVLEKVIEKRLRRRWVKKRILNSKPCAGEPIQVPGEDLSFHGG